MSVGKSDSRIHSKILCNTELDLKVDFVLVMLTSLTSLSYWTPEKSTHFPSGFLRFIIFTVFYDYTGNIFIQENKSCCNRSGWNDALIFLHTKEAPNLLPVKFNTEQILPHELIPPSVSALSSLCFCCLICHSCWDLLSKIIHGINSECSLIWWFDMTVDLVSCIVFLDLSDWKNRKKSPRQLKNWQVNQSVPSLHVHLLHALNGIFFFLFLIFLTFLCQTNAQLCLCTQKSGLVWSFFCLFFVFPSG